MLNHQRLFLKASTIALSVFLLQAQSASAETTTNTGDVEALFTQGLSQVKEGQCKAAQSTLIETVRLMTLLVNNCKDTGTPASDGYADSRPINATPSEIQALSQTELMAFNAAETSAYLSRAGNCDEAQTALDSGKQTVETNQIGNSLVHEAISVAQAHLDACTGENSLSIEWAQFREEKLADIQEKSGMSVDEMGGCTNAANSVQTSLNEYSQYREFSQKRDLEWERAILKVWNTANTTCTKYGFPGWNAYASQFQYTEMELNNWLSKKDFMNHSTQR